MVKEAFVTSLQTARPARFKPEDMEDLKQHLAVLIREHVRCTYRSQAEAAAALGSTQSRISNCVTGKLQDINVEFLLRIAMKAGLLKRIEVTVE